MIKQKVYKEPLTVFLIIILLLLGATLADRIKRQIVFEDDRENRLFSSECRTPDRKSGQCIQLTSCTILMRKLNLNRLRQYFCGFEGEEPKVCCPHTRLELTTLRPRTSSTSVRTISTSTARTTRTTPIPRTTTRTTSGTAPSPRTTSRTTIRTTTRKPTARTTIPLPEQPRNGESSTSGTTRRPTHNTKPSFLPPVCGKLTSPTHQRVVGGTVAQQGSWPWMAVVYVRRSSGALIPECGGSLVTNRHVITAAHCLVTLRRSVPLIPSRIVVRLGAHNLSVLNEYGAMDVGIEDVRLHEQFNALTFKNDIAVLKLKHPVPFTEKITPVCLPYDSLRNDDLTSRAAYVIGYGTSSLNGNASDLLMQAGFYIQSQEICERAYEKEVKITKVYLCAGMMDGSKDACQGDSGGPLVTTGKNSNFYLVGVVSFGKQCGLPNYPGVYTRITEFLDWLSENISD